MSDPTPQGILSLNQDAIIRTVANCPHWQAWTKTNNEAEARQRIRRAEFQVPFGPEDDEGQGLIQLEQARPFAQVAFDTEGGFTYVHAGSKGWTTQGRSILHIEDDVDLQNNTIEVALQLFQDNLGLLWKELMDLENTENYIMLADTIPLRGPFVSGLNEPNASGAYHFAQLILNWSNV